jgi:hypothetical protein
MLRLRPSAALLLFALVALGLASSAGATLLARGDCCQAMLAMGGASEPVAPCASLAPSSCCEERAPSAALRALHAPALAIAFATAPPLASPYAPAGSALAPTRSARLSLATVVLRL